MASDDTPPVVCSKRVRAGLQARRFKQGRVGGKKGHILEGRHGKTQGGKIKIIKKITNNL